MFGPKGDTHSFSNRGKQSLGMVPARPTVPAQDFTKRPTLPAPGISKGPTQARPARESLQPPRTPSATFGGYRGANEAKAQRPSWTGQPPRAVREYALLPPLPLQEKVSSPAGRPATGSKDGKQGKAGKQDKKGSSR